MIENRIYSSRIKTFIVILLFVLAAIVLFYFNYHILGVLCTIITIIIVKSTNDGIKYHKRLINWIDENKDYSIFIYSSKKKFETIIEEEILKELNNNWIIIKNDNAIISGSIPLHVYKELHYRIKIKDLPFIINFKGYAFKTKSLQYDFEQLIKGKTSIEEIKKKIKTGYNNS